MTWLLLVIVLIVGLVVGFFIGGYAGAYVILSRIKKKVSEELFDWLIKKIDFDCNTDIVDAINNVKDRFES